MAFKIRGIIGLDIDGDEFAERLSKVSGDVDFEINSPGGSVFHGIRIFNAIKKYDRGKCRMHVVGDCSSMAAYIMLAGDGDVEFEPNSIVVLHNPWSFASGDYRAMQKEAEILEGMSKLYASEFVKRKLFKESEIRSIMDAETWFMGEDLKKLGKVLEDSNCNDDEEENSNETQEIRVAALRLRMEETKSKINALKIDNSDKIAALITSNNYNGSKQEKEFENIEIQEKKGETKMVKSLEELKIQNASIYNEAKSEGQKAEQKRVASLMKFIDVDKQAVIKAINDGVGVNDDEFQASILEARTNKKQIAEMESENPSNIDPKTETHAPEQQGEGEEPSEEEKAKAQKEAEDKKFNALIEAMGIKQD